MDIKFHCNEKGNFSKGYPVRAFTYRDYSIEMHNHDFYELNIVLAGKGIHCIENRQLPVRRGDVFVIPPMVAHAYVDTEKLEVYHILLKKSFLSENQEESQKVNGFLRLMEIEPFLRGNSPYSHFLHLNSTQMILLKNELEYLDDHSELTWEECAQLKYHGVWKLLYWFSRLLSEQTALLDSASENRYEAQIIRALEYIHTHYAEKITVDILCKEVYLSRSTFLRNFKLVCAVSPMNYVNNYRCKKALQYLELSRQSKTQIAHSCGFYDLSHMERTLGNYR